jgi:Mce-associated membrane protein
MSVADSDSGELDAVAEDEAVKPTKRQISMSPVRLATVVGVVAILALGGVVGWLGFKTYQLRQDQEQRELFLRVGRQGAVNLTTIDWQNVNNDIQRILDSATGPFYDDFSKRSQPFIEVVKKVQSKSVGTVTEAGLESLSRNEARVLVAVSVKTSNLGAEDQPPRAWRMRIDVQKVGGGAKVSNVLFVPS